MAKINNNNGQLKSIKFNEKKRKLNVSVENLGKIIKYSIPSNELPVKDKSKFLIFTTSTTELITDKNIISIIDNMSPKIGHCYSNTDEIVNALKEKGYNCKFFAGWMIVDGIPIYHAWCVYGAKEQHVIDFSLNEKEMEISSTIDRSVENYRDKYTDEIEKIRNLPLSQRATIGKAIPGIIYLGCETDSRSARELYWEIVANKAGVFYRLQTEGMNPHGASKTQETMLKRGMQ